MINCKLDIIKSKLPQKIDAFLCCASFEQRCFSITKEISELSINKSFIFYNPNYSELIISNKDYLKQLLSNANPIEKPFNIKSPIEHIVTFIQIFENIKSNDSLNIVIDITTFTHETLLILINIIKNRIDFNKDNVYLLYNIAKDYSTDINDIKNKWLTKGIKDIRSVITYPGLMNPTKPYHLIILTGFEVERTIKLIENYDVSLISLGLGYSNISGEHINYMMEITLSKHEELKNYFNNVETFKFSLVDPIITKDEILNHISQFDNTNSVIAPMSNKISTIGAALANFINPSIQLCYSSANQYNIDNYSEPSDDCVIINMKDLFL